MPAEGPQGVRMPRDHHEYQLLQRWSGSGRRTGQPAHPTRTAHELKSQLALGLGRALPCPWDLAPHPIQPHCRLTASSERKGWYQNHGNKAAGTPENESSRSVIALSPPFFKWAAHFENHLSRGVATSLSHSPLLS